jgi:iron(III) transport system permease protein
VVATSLLARPGSWYQSVLPTRPSPCNNYDEALGHEMTVGSIRNSLLYASLAVLFNTVLGIAIAFVVVRSDLKARGALDALSMLPLAVPGLVMAFGYLAISSMLSNTDAVKESPFCSSPCFDVRTNPTLFLVIAYSIRRLPYVVRSAVAGLQQTSVSLEEAAANLGALPLFTPAPHHPAPHHGQPDRRRAAGLRLLHAGGVRQPDAGPAHGPLSHHQNHLRTLPAHRHRQGTSPPPSGVWAMVFLAVTIAGSSLLSGQEDGGVVPGVSSFPTLVAGIEYRRDARYPSLLMQPSRVHIPPRPFPPHTRSNTIEQDSPASRLTTPWIVAPSVASFLRDSVCFPCSVTPYSSACPCSGVGTQRQYQPPPSW